jgi:S1-C subfamily serine protease
VPNIRFQIAVLALAVAALSPAAAPARARSTPRPPWLVSVNHRIDLDAYVTLARGGVGRVEMGVVRQPSARRVVNLTSGILVDTEGHVVTRLVNLLPTAPSHDISVTAADGRTLRAEFVGLDAPSGFAVLRVLELRGIRPAPVRTVTALSDAELVNILSPDYRRVPMASKQRLFPTLPPAEGRVLQGTATPLLARSGVVGVIESRAFVSSSDLSLIESKSGDVLGVAKYVAPGRGHVFPIAFVRDVVARRVVETRGNVSAGWLGADGTSVADLAATQRPGGASAGVIIDSVVPDGPAALAGMRAGDLVLLFDKVSVANAEDLGTAIRSTPANTAVTIAVMRDGAQIALRPLLGGQPLAPGANAQPSGADTVARLTLKVTQLEAQLARTSDAAKRDELQKSLELYRSSLEQAVREAKPAAAPVTVESGVVLEELSRQLAEYSGVEGGVLVKEVKPGSAAERAGLQAKDIIVRVGDVGISNRASFLAAMLDAASSRVASVTIVAQRRGEPLSLTLALSSE